jgi:hypothetical protein
MPKSVYPLAQTLSMQNRRNRRNLLPRRKVREQRLTTKGTKITKVREEIKPPSFPNFVSFVCFFENGIKEGSLTELYPEYLPRRVRDDTHCHSERMRGIFPEHFYSLWASATHDSLRGEYFSSKLCAFALSRKILRVRLPRGIRLTVCAFSPYLAASTKKTFLG